MQYGGNQENQIQKLKLFIGLIRIHNMRGIKSRGLKMDSEKQLIKRIKGKSSKTAANELVSKYYKEIYIWFNPKKVLLEK